MSLSIIKGPLGVTPRNYDTGFDEPDVAFDKHRGRRPEAAAKQTFLYAAPVMAGQDSAPC